MHELRMLIAETLLTWAAAIAPKNEDGMLLIGYLHDYCKAANERMPGGVRK